MTAVDLAIRSARARRLMREQRARDLDTALARWRRRWALGRCRECGRP